MPALRACVTALIAALALTAGAATATATPPTTANLYIVPSGGTSSCVAQTTPVDFASAPSPAKCASITRALVATNIASGMTIVVRDGTSYPGEGTSDSCAGTSLLGTFSTSNPVKVIGNGDATAFASMEFGDNCGGGHHGVVGVTIDGVLIKNGLTVKNGSFFTLTNSHVTDQVYIEGSPNTTLDGNDFDGTVKGNVDDLVDIYEASRAPADNDNVTITDNLIHHARASSSGSHPDGLQFCNCGSGSQFPTGILIARNKFYDNECPNVRFNTSDAGVVENNYFENGTSVGISSCPSNATYQADTGAFTGTVRYNTFAGNACIQGTNTTGGEPVHVQNWIGNVGTCGVNAGNGCGSFGGNASTSTFSHNIWIGMTCGTGDINAANAAARKLNADGTLQTGSPAIDAGDNTNYPAVDFTGASRFAGSGPDIGAFELGASGGTAGISATDTAAASDSSAVGVFATTPAGITSVTRISAG